MIQKVATIKAYNIENLEIPEHKIAFMEWNNIAKTTIVCMHGLISNSRDFDYLAEQLSNDFRIISIDAPGRGKSDWFEDKSLYQYSVYVADILALLKSLEITEIHWIGTSMGGITGMILASNYPQMIKSLILNDIGPEIPGKALAKMRKYVGMDPTFSDIPSAKRHLQMIYKNFGITEDIHWDHLVLHTTYLSEDGLYRLKYDPQISQTFIMDPTNPEDITFWDLWNKISCPTLIIQGMQSDILLQSTVDKMSQKSQVDIYEMHNAGHAPALMDSKEINYIHQWLLQL